MDRGFLGPAAKNRKPLVGLSAAGAGGDHDPSAAGAGNLEHPGGDGAGVLRRAGAFAVVSTQLERPKYFEGAPRPAR